MIRRRKCRLRKHRRFEGFRPRLELLERRSLLAGDLQITNVQFVDVDNTPITNPVVGEQVFLRTDWTAADLASSDSYYLRITDQTAGITPITLDSATFRRNAFGVETRSTVLGGWFAGLGQHHVEITIDYGNSVAETNEANNKILLNYVASTPDTLVQKFVQPLYGKQNEDFSIVHYVDLDPQPDDGVSPPEIRDYLCDDHNIRPYPRCGPFTYDGSRGIDFQLPNFAAMDKGQAVYAAAPGIVSKSLDGFTIHGIALDDNTGTVVSSIGDLNYDGLSDFLITAPNADADLNGDLLVDADIGETFIVYGHFGGYPQGFELSSLLPANGGDGSRGFVVRGMQAGDTSGLSVTNHGDFNHDGIRDLVIAAPNATGNGSSSGQVFVVYGLPTGFPAIVDLSSLTPAAGGDGSAGFILNGERAGDRAGTSVAFAGDVNGDGIDDLLVGAPLADIAGGFFFQFNAGRTYVVFGTDAAMPPVVELSSLTPTSLLTPVHGFLIDGASSFEQSGTSVAGVGDINGDGVADIGLGAPFAGFGFTGNVYVVFGRSQADQVLNPFPTRFRLSSLQANRGGDGTLGFILRGAAQGDQTGTVVTSVGDVNGDALPDFAVGAPGAEAGVTNSGLAYIVYGHPAPYNAEMNISSLLPFNGGNGSAGMVFEGGNALDGIGKSIAAIGDFNGDGLGDLAIGAPGLDTGGSGAGGIYIVYGSATPYPALVDLTTLGQNLATAGMILDGVGGAAGTSVSGVGDFNGDGVADVLIGAPTLEVNGIATGGGYVVFGRAGGYRREVSLGQLETTTQGSIEIDHGNGWVTRYSHLDPNSITVKPGEHVVAGDILALVGSRPQGDAQLRFEVQHQGAVVETYLDPTAYWLHPFEYQGATPRTILAAGVTNLDPTNDLEEGPSNISLLHPTYAGNLWFWFRLSHLNPYDEWQVTWYRPDGTAVPDLYHCQLPKQSPLFATNPPFCQSLDASPNHFGLITSTLKQNWKDYPGNWRAELKVNGEVRGIVPFAIASSPIIPEVRVTYGPEAPSNPIILDGRQTPVDFGDVLVGATKPSQTFHIENHGSTALHVSNLVIPPGFNLLTPLPTLVNVSGSVPVTLELDTTTAGLKFGEVRFTSDDADEGLFTFLVQGNVRGAVAFGSPQLELPAGPATFQWGQPPQLLDPQAQVSDPNSATFVQGALRVELAAGADVNDRLAIRDQGAGVGQIGLSGDQVTYSGIAFGVVTGGDGLNPLIVTFNDEATLPAVQALVRNVTFANTSNAAGTTPRYARYSLTDDTGAASNSPVKLVVMGPSNLNQLPTIATLLADPSPVLQPSTMSLTASGVVDVDGFVQKVSFYVESNNLLGLQTGPGGDLLSGADNDGTNGWSVSFSSLLLTPGTRTAYAVAEDDLLAVGEPVSVDFKVIAPDIPPSIVFLSANPTTVIPPDSTTLTANGVSDPDGYVTRVDFYRETNGVSGLQIGSDLGIGFDTSSAGGWNTQYSTAGLSNGVYLFYAVATDNAGALSEPVSTTVQVGSPPPAGSVFYLSDLFPPTGNGSSGLVLRGKATGDHAGYTVSSAGDVNRDGFDDLLIGSPLADVSNPNRADAGISYVVFGKVDGFAPVIDLDALNGANGFRILGAAAGDNAGSVSAAGDVNGDGYGDLIIGAPGVDVPGQPDSGAAYVVFGRPSGFGAQIDLSALNGLNGFRLTGLATGDQTGLAVSSAGDFNLDGYADVLVAARSADPGSPARQDAGVAYVIFGDASGFSASISLGSLAVDDGFRIEGFAPSSFLGQAVRAAGDLNGDGFGDLVIGAQMGTPGTGAAQGAAFVIFGTATTMPNPLRVDALNGINGFRISGLANDDLLGFSVSTAGDFNGDGLDDIVVGVPGADPGNPTLDSAGSAYVIYGAAIGWASVFDLGSLTGGNGFRVDGIHPQGFLGVSVATAGDVNGDGFDDLLLGASGASPGIPARNQAGESYVVFGHSNNLGPAFDLGAINGQNGFRIEGALSADGSGAAVAAAGDVNGDGFDDLVIGAPNATFGSPPQTGGAFVLFGRDFNHVVGKLGSKAVDTLTGDLLPNVLIGAQANDTLVGQGGADVLRGGQGDDVLAVSDVSFGRLVGGRGIDTLRLDGANLSLDLTSYPDNRLQGLEVIDLTGTGDNSLTLNADELLKLSDDSNELTVHRNTGDTVSIGTGWTLTAYRDIAGQSYYVLQQGTATLVLQAVAGGTPWQNPVNALDVDNDGLVIPQDGLIMVNFLNSQGQNNEPLPNPPTPSFAPKPLGNESFYDVNGDGYATPIDALIVINFLNQPPGGGEGEGTGDGELADVPSGRSAAATLLVMPTVPLAAGESGSDRIPRRAIDGTSTSDASFPKWPVVASRAAAPAGAADESTRMAVGRRGADSALPGSWADLDGWESVLESLALARAR